MVEAYKAKDVLKYITGRVDKMRVGEVGEMSARDWIGALSFTAIKTTLETMAMAPLIGANLYYVENFSEQVSYADCVGLSAPAFAGVMGLANFALGYCVYKYTSQDDLDRLRFGEGYKFKKHFTDALERVRENRSSQLEVSFEGGGE